MPSDEKDVFVFVGVATVKQAQEYAKKNYSYEIPEEDIIGVYILDGEYDIHGNKYKVSIKRL